MGLRLIALCGLLLLGGCNDSPQPELLEERRLAQGMAGALIDTGLYAKVTVTRVLGGRYAPGTGRWTVLGCYRFSLADGNVGENCIDSFQAFQLDTGRWVVAATVNDIYRWRALAGPASDQPEDRSGASDAD